MAGIYAGKAGRVQRMAGNMIASGKIFDDAEAAHPITEEEFIKVEDIAESCFWSVRKTTRSGIRQSISAAWKNALPENRMSVRLKRLFTHTGHISSFRKVCCKSYFPSARTLS